VKVNEGGLDRVIRIVIALIAGYAGYRLGGTWGTVLYVVGAVALITGAVGFCGLYALLGINTCKVKR